MRLEKSYEDKAGNFIEQGDVHSLINKHRIVLVN